MDSVATLEENFCTLLGEFTAGDPMREGVLWTNLSRREISRRLCAMRTPLELSCHPGRRITSGSYS